VAEGVRLRAATAQDGDRLREWRNDPELVASTFSEHPVEADEHRSWLERVLADSDERMLVAEADGEPVGQVRLQARGEGEVEVHIGLASHARGRGLGTLVLELAAERAADDAAARSLVARVRADNERSLRAFAAAGFRERTRESSEVVLERRLG